MENLKEEEEARFPLFELKKFVREKRIRKG